MDRHNLPISKYVLINYPVIPYKPRKVNEKVWLVDIPLSNTAIGKINGNKNVLTHVWWALIFGLMLNTNVNNVVDEGGTSRTIRTSGDVNASTAYLEVGTGTVPEAITDYKLSNRVKDLTASISIGTSTDRSRITVSAVSDADYNEVGIGIKLQAYYPEGAYWAETRFLLSRKVTSITANQAISYHIDFIKPWLYNMGLVAYGVLSNSNVSGVRDIGGNSITVRTSGDFNNGAIYMVVSDQQTAWSVDMYNMPTMINMTTYRSFSNLKNVVYLFLVGLLAPANDMDIYSVGLVQSLLDTGGNAWDVLLFCHVFDTPITFKGNRTNVIIIRFVAV